MKTEHGFTISEGNTKTKIPSFNLLAGNQKELYTGAVPSSCDRDVCGTCPCSCPGCYAMRMTRYPAVYNAFRENTKRVTGPCGLIWLQCDILSYIDEMEPRRFRIHDSGDFFSYEYFVTWDQIARRRPDTIFYCYTKRVDFLERFINDFGRDPYFIVSLSTWPGIIEPDDLREIGLENFPRFEYDDGSRPELQNVKHCPAVDKNGHRTGITCSWCKHCSNAKTGDVWAVYAH